LASSGILSAVRVTAPQARFLQFLADPGRGGEISWNWSACRPDVVAMVTDLVQKGLLSDLRVEGRIRLTDQGRSAVSQIEFSVRNATRLST
jgi:hypothetical protein